MANAAPIVFTNGAVFFSTSTGALAIAGFDISTRVRQVAFTAEAEEHDVTAMGSNGWRARVPGLKSANAELTLYQDFESSSTGAGAIDKRFFDLMDNNVLFNLELRHFNAARSSDNPGYQMPTRAFTHNPLSGEVGSVLMTTVRLLSAGQLIRAVSSS